MLVLLLGVSNGKCYNKSAVFRDTRVVHYFVSVQLASQLSACSPCALHCSSGLRAMSFT